MNADPLGLWLLCDLLFFLVHQPSVMGLQGFWSYAASSASGILTSGTVHYTLHTFRYSVIPDQDTFSSDNFLHSVRIRNGEIIVHRTFLFE